MLVDNEEELVISVSSIRSTSRCPQCGYACRKVHDSRVQSVRDLPISGRKTTLSWQRRRFSCDNCGERHQERNPSFEGRLTARLARTLVADAKVMAIRRVAARHGISWAAVMYVVANWAQLVQERRCKARTRVLLVEQTSMRRRHRYVTVLQNGETGEVLAMVAHRNGAALRGFFLSQGQRWCKGVEVVVTDGSHAYRAAIEADLAGAIHVVDRFHVSRWFAAGLTAVRRETQRREEGTTPVFDPEVFRARFLLLRRGDRLEEEAFSRLIPIFGKHPRLACAWGALRCLHGVYMAKDKSEALSAIMDFCDLVEDGSMPEFDSVIHSLRRWGARSSPFITPEPGVSATDDSRGPTTSSRSCDALLTWLYEQGQLRSQGDPRMRSGGIICLTESEGHPKISLGLHLSTGIAGGASREKWMELMLMTSSSSLSTSTSNTLRTAGAGVRTDPHSVKSQPEPPLSRCSNTPSSAGLRSARGDP